jgi:hypothetical protein
MARLPIRGQTVNSSMAALFRMVEVFQRDYLIQPATWIDRHSRTNVGSELGGRDEQNAQSDTLAVVPSRLEASDG